MGSNPVVEFYGRSDEHRRMERNPLEFCRTKELLARHLPPAPCRVLDVGGATGAYSYWLAGLGYDVTLVDFSPNHIETVRELQKTAPFPLRLAVVGDARSLPFEDNSFEAVLVMGPLYHLLDRSDRVGALSEARRVVVPGGAVAATVISKPESTATPARPSGTSPMRTFTALRNSKRNGKTPVWVWTASRPSPVSAGRKPARTSGSQQPSAGQRQKVGLLDR